MPRNVEHRSPSVTAPHPRRPETPSTTSLRCLRPWWASLESAAARQREEVLGAFGRGGRLLASSCPSVCPHAAVGLPLDGFAWNFVFYCVSRVCLENSASFKIWQKYRVLYMKTTAHLSSHVAELFWEFKMFQTEFVQKSKTRVLCSTTFSRKSCRLWDNVENIVEADRPLVT